MRKSLARSVRNLEKTQISDVPLATRWPIGQIGEKASVRSQLTWRILIEAAGDLASFRRPGGSVGSAWGR